MREIAEAPLLPAGRRKRKLDSGPVMPLITLLDSFEPKSKDRELTFAEDALAIFMLRSLVPEDEVEITACVENFLNPNYRNFRTLTQWYLYTKHLAMHFDLGQCRRHL